MTMNTTLSVYFGSERTYISLLNTAREGIEVLHVNAFPQTLRNEDDIQILSQIISKDLAPYFGMVQMVNFSIPIGINTCIIHQCRFKIGVGNVYILGLSTYNTR